MRIGGIENVYPNFVYNTNAVSANSLNKLSRISDNVLDKKVDYEANTEEKQNPLRKGETKDFQNILAKQMQEGQNRAAAILPFGLAPSEETTAQRTEPGAGQGTKEAENTETAQDENVVSISDSQVQNQQEQNNVSYQMQRALQAYEMFTAV